MTIWLRSGLSRIEKNLINHKMYSKLNFVANYMRYFYFVTTSYPHSIKNLLTVVQVSGILQLVDHQLS